MSDMKPVEEYKILDEPSLEKIRTLSVYYSKRSQLSKASIIPLVRSGFRTRGTRRRTAGTDSGF